MLFKKEGPVLNSKISVVDNWCLAKGLIESYWGQQSIWGIEDEILTKRAQETC